MFSFLADMIRVCSVVSDIRGTGGSEDDKGAKGRKRYQLENCGDMYPPPPRK